MSNQELEVNQAIVDRLKKNIIIKESQNLKTRAYSDPQMVNWIKKKIEEEVKCYLNQ